MVKPNAGKAPPSPASSAAAGYVYLGRYADAVSFDSYAGTRGPWSRQEAHVLLMDGLRKAGWRGETG